MTIPGVSAKMLKVWVRKAVNCSHILSMTRHHQDLEFLSSRWSVESPRLLPRGGVWTHVVNLTMKSLYGERNAIGIVNGEKDEANFQLLTYAMTTSKTSSNSNYASLLRYFNERDGSQSVLMLKALLSYWLSCFVHPRRLEDGLNNYAFLLAIS